MTSNSRAAIIEPDMARQKLCGNPSRLQHHGPRQPVDITLVKISIIYFQSITLSEVLLSYCQKQILFIRFLFCFFGVARGWSCNWLTLQPLGAGAGSRNHLHLKISDSPRFFSFVTFQAFRHTCAGPEAEETATCKENKTEKEKGGKGQKRGCEGRG